MREGIEMTKSGKDQIASAIMETFISPNECDTNYEPANVVDGLFAIARAIYRLADVMENKKEVS